jgi:hypothetical protein
MLNYRIVNVLITKSGNKTMKTVSSLKNMTDFNYFFEVI